MTGQQPIRPRPGDYRIAVENLGPIVTAEVDVRPLTIFVGPSNTGKSYLAVLLYVLHRCLGRGVPYGYGAAGFPGRRGRPLDFSDTPARQTIHQSLDEWVAAFLRSETPQDLPADVAEHLHSALQAAEGLEDSVSYELRRCFGVEDVGVLVRRAGKAALTRVCLGMPWRADSEARYDFELGSNVSRMTGRFPLVTSLLHDDTVRAAEWIEHLLRSTPAREDKSFALDGVLRFLMNWVAASVLGPLYRNAHYLPADRTGVMHSHQVVVSTIVQSASTTGLRPSPDVPMLSGVLTDFLDQLIGIGGHTRERRSRSGVHGDGIRAGNLADLLEENVLKGAVVTERSETGYPTFAYRPRGWRDDIALMRASSMVSELAPVVLYLRYVVQPGDLLIIEEPEAHLHPAMQTAFARELARLVHAGVRVVMTTHSEWFLEQIGNLVRAGTLPRKKRTRIPGAEFALDPGQVGAWLFRPCKRPRGSIVEEVRFDPESGLFPTDYDQVSEALYNQSALMFNSLQEAGQ